MMVKNNVVSKYILFLILSSGVLNNAYSQSYKAYKKLSNAEKCWVVFHPFKAKKAYRVTKNVEKTVDSILKIGFLGNHHVGNQLDAFKHSFWMWSLAEEIGKHSAKNLGKQHEKGNYQFFKEHQLEDGELPDKASFEMDLFNNAIGLAFYKQHKKEDFSKKEIISILIQAVIDGKMQMIYQTENQKYIDSLGQIIPKEEYYRLWENRKCLVPSSAEYLMTDK